MRIGLYAPLENPVHFRQFMRYRELLPKGAFVNFLSKFFRAAKGVK